MLSWVALPVYAGSSIVDRIKGGATKYLLPKGLDVDDKIVKIRVRAVWLGNGFFAAIGSVVSGPLGGSALCHWWVEIETAKGYYCAQFDEKHKLRLTKHDSVQEVTGRGKQAAGCHTWEHKNISDKYTRQLYKLYTMKDIANFMIRYNGTYSLVNNNSQDFGKKLYFSSYNGFS